MDINEFLGSNTIIDESKIKYEITRFKEYDDHVIIFLDNNEKIHVSVDNYFKYSLSNQKGLDEKTYKKLKDEERTFMAYRGCLRKISVKDCSCKQIYDYLKLKFDLTLSEEKYIVNRLLQFSLLDDERFTKGRAAYLSKQLLSCKQIENKLLKDGISLDLIKKYVIINTEEEYSKAFKIASKYDNSIKNKSLNAKKQSILQKLVSLGFRYDTAKSAIDDLNITSSNEDELLKKEYLKAKNKYSKKYSDYELSKHIYSYLLQKGFNSQDIKKIMEV